MALCNETFGSFEGAAGWGTETVCGEPDPVGTLAKLNPFGVLATVTPDGWGTARSKRRGIGHQEITQNRRTSFLGGLSIEYAAIASEISDMFTRVMGGASMANHLSTFCVETGLNRATATVAQERWLYNRCKTNVLTLAFALDEPIMATEAILAQYPQRSPTNDKDYAELRFDPADATTKIYDALTMGADPDAISEDMLMYYDADFILVEDPGGTPVDIPLTDVSDLSLEINRNLDPRRGIRKGHGIIYEHGEKSRALTLTLTKDFHNATEYARMIDNELFDFRLEIGPTLIATLTGGKWEEPPPTVSDEDLVGESLTAEFEGLTIS